MIDADTARSYFKRYKQGGIKMLGHVGFRGSQCWLEEIELAALDAHLTANLYLTA